jgi:hypothetical protein
VSHKQIRTTQLIAPFGPGTLYTDRRGTPHVICGLDYWFKRVDAASGQVIDCSDPSEFERFEPRLSELLRVNRFRMPPDFRHVRPGAKAPPNALLYTPALRFPRWYRHSKTGQLHLFNLDTQRTGTPWGGGRWLPVRFVSACQEGHLCEFPWKKWIGCQCESDESLYLTDRGGADLSSIRIECRACPEGSTGRRGRSLAGTTARPDDEDPASVFQKAGIDCPGDRPWLGEDAGEACDKPLVGALINQTNLYFANTISAILLPEMTQADEGVVKVRNAIESDPSNCAIAKTLWTMGNKAGAVAIMQVSLKDQDVEVSDDLLTRALQSLFEKSATLSAAEHPAEPESRLLTFRREEFNILRNKVDEPKTVPNLRVIPSVVPDDLRDVIARVNLVERLRETRVFFGFDRLQQKPPALNEMPDSALSQLFLYPPSAPQDKWLPATEVFGEGIYLELNESAISNWQVSQREWIASRIDDAFLVRLAGQLRTLPPLGAARRAWGSRYLLVHSLSHLLINQLVFECGYGTASLRERLYISADPSAPMAGFLIYTAAGDSEGTLGGLVRLGRADRLSPVVRRAISRASWCSADPVCSENLGGQGSFRTNLAACHACVLLPETSCETINHGLDRATIVGTPNERNVGFLSHLLEDAYALV